MRHPLEAIAPPRRRRLLLVLTGLTLALWAILLLHGKQLTTPAAPWGLVSLALAGDAQNSREIVSGWSESARVAARLGLGLDFLFLLVYPNTLALACLAVASARQLTPWLVATLARPLAWALWVAGLSDAIENLALLVLLLGSPTDPWPQVARWSAALKFALVLAGLVYLVVGTLLPRTARRPCDASGRAI